MSKSPAEIVKWALGSKKEEDSVQEMTSPGLSIIDKVKSRIESRPVKDQLSFYKSFSDKLQAMFLDETPSADAKFSKFAREVKASFADMLSGEEDNDGALEIDDMEDEEEDFQAEVEEKALTSEETRLKDKINQISGNIRKTQSKINSAKEDNTDLDKSYIKSARESIKDMRAEKAKLIVQFNAMRKKSEDLEVEEKTKPMASSSQKAAYSALRKKEDALDKKKEQLLAQMSKEADDDKRGKIQDELHKTREEMFAARDEIKAMWNKFRGLRSKD